MLRRFSFWGPGLGVALVASATVAACGAGGASTTGGTSKGTGGAPSTSSGTHAGGNENSGDGTFVGSSGVGGAGGMAQAFDVQPSMLQTITVPIGQSAPTVTYTATLDGQPISAGWGVDSGNIGTLPAGPSTAATFTPTGKTGGLVTIQAGLNGQTVNRQIMVQLTGTQDGGDPNNPAELPQIPATVPVLTAGGGVGGVGGEGLGPAVMDMTTLDVLKNPSGNGQAQGLGFLYPYDKTVWPRGMLAPLLMWDWAMADADAIQIDLKTTSGSFSWTGTFGRPAILKLTGGAFIRHPIPQDIWDIATNTAGGATPNNKPDKLIVSLTVAKGGQAYGPISETWTVAPARLSGIIYYNSYGTQLAQNLGGAVGGNGKFGGAVLSIHVGDTAPTLTAGSNGGTAQCRVCHSVAADGSRLVTQHGDNYGVTSAYDLGPMGSSEKALAIGTTFPAMYPDGSKALSPTGQLLPLPVDSVPLAVSGLNAVSTNLGTPAFAPDGKLVVFNPMAGPGVVNPLQKLLVMSFDAVNNTFSNPLTIVDDTGQPAETRPGWPAFFPDSQSVVFHHQSAAGLDGNGSGAMATRKGARAQIAMSKIAGAPNVTPLNQLNGMDAMNSVYLPKLLKPVVMSCTADGAQVGNVDANHGDDVNLNYEPTVNPVASGGYAWVVFTSRRMYGNEAAIPPFCSDPRGVDLVKNLTTKKLWVAAIDLNAQPGTDASHPAFYLPAQELVAGNARGFWVLDPCRPNGQTCSSGDQCCNGFCQPNGPGGSLVCSDMPPNNTCSKTSEKCTTAADCCDKTNICINGFCAQNAPH